MGRSKGQVMVFEQVLLFVIGVMIFIICLSVFDIYRDHFNSVSVEDGLKQLEAVVSSNIIKLAEKPYGTNSTITLEIPSTIGGSQYSIELNGSSLSITTAAGLKRTTDLYNLGGSCKLGGGRILSTRGRFIIYKKENNIILA